MPRPPPRPLCLPDLVKNPQAREEYIQSHPAVHGISSPYLSSSRTDPSRCPNGPSSPSSIDVHSNRTSSATMASLNSLPTPASTSTSSSLHNAFWASSIGKRVSGPGGGLTSAASEEDPGADGNKVRASWSNAIANTKSWFRNVAAAESEGAKVLTVKKGSQKEIKLSPSMIAAHAATMTSSSPRPLSSPYPSAPEPPPLSPTGSDIFSFRTPRVGSGLRYYTEQNPAPTQVRVQIPDPIELHDHDQQRPAPLPHNSPTPTITAFAKPIPTATTSYDALDIVGLKDEAVSREEARGPLSPPPTPPANVRDSDVPHIRISSGDDL